MRTVCLPAPLVNSARLESGNRIVVPWDVPIRDFDYEITPTVRSTAEVDADDPSVSRITLVRARQDTAYTVRITGAEGRSGAPLAELTAFTMKTPEPLDVRRLSPRGGAFGVNLDTTIYRSVQQLGVPAYDGERLAEVMRERQNVLLPCLPQPLPIPLCPLALADILDHGDVIAGVAPHVAEERDGHARPHGRTIAAHEALFQRVGVDLPGQQPSLVFSVDLEVLGNRQLAEGWLSQLFASVAENAAHALVEAQEASVEPDVGDAHRGLLEGGAETLFAFAKRVLDHLALGLCSLQLGDSLA